MSKIVGIDLGTTNSCIAVIEGNEPVIIPNSEGQRTTPSIVAFTKDNTRLIGEAAKRQTVTNKKNTFISIKRKMGTNYVAQVKDRKLTPQEISSMIIGKLKKDAEKYLGEEISEAVITVPAYFNDIQRQAARDAGKIAGLNVKRIINEPTAAALAYGIKNNTSQKIIVYDFGGGTLDVSLLEIGNNVIEVIATTGNNQLGGDDIDLAITSYIINEFKKSEGIDLINDPISTQRIREAAEILKKDLSYSLSANVNLPFIAQVNGEPKHIDMTFSRSKMEEIAAHIFKDALQPLKDIINETDCSNVSKIILVGGSTRIPYIQEMIHNLCHVPVEKTVNPDECVAMGAAIQGEILLHKDVSNALLLIDIVPLTLSVELADGTCKPIIKKNQTIPTTFTDTFTTGDDYQDNLWIRIYQGERLMANDNFLIGDAVISGILPAPKGEPSIEITFNIDENGMIGIQALEKATGKVMNAYIKSRTLSPEEINRAIRDSIIYDQEDKINKEKNEIVNTIEAFITKVKKDINQYNLNQNEKLVIQEITDKANDIMKNKNLYNITEMENELEILKSTTNELYSDFYQRIGNNGDNPYSGEDKPCNNFYEEF